HGIRSIVCQALGGLAEDDPRLTALLSELAGIVGRPVTQLARLEAGFVLLAQQLEPHLLPGALGQLVDALLPDELEQRAQDGHANRGFGLQLKDDGSGWVITDRDLDLECGELLQAVLAAELAVDPDSPADTEAFEQLRAEGWQDGDPLPDSELLGPRSLRQKRHDALKNGLRRYLNSGIAGLRDKVAPHLAVTVGIDLLQADPGALPAVSTTTGARLPASLVRRWACDGALGRFVLGLGGRVIETSHTERTLKPHERRIKKIETGNRCQIAGCRCGPGSGATSRLVPHHPDAYARSGTTSLSDTVWICERHHHDLHTGKKALRLRDGRWLDEHGWIDGAAR
ncbi:MAG: 13E12 repeat family protein, partial [Frankiaceae bacterium]|nr:13E12 repeat family protein [Frankiaceae bacterium]